MKILNINLSSENSGSDLVKSFRETGFAVITNHDIDPQLIKDAYLEWESFFQSHIKHSFKFNSQDTYQAGFFPFRSENAKDNPIKDLKEFYHVYSPKDYPTFFQMKATEKLRKSLIKLGNELLLLIQQNTDPSVFQSSEPLESMVDPQHLTLFRILHYPPLFNQSETGAIRASAHEDINLITLLPAATQSGLQVKDIDGKWHDIKSNFGNIIVNVGDMLQLASNNYFKSTTHQVVNPNGEEALKPRYSMPLFVAPREDVMLSKNKSAKEYLNERLLEIGLKK